MASRIDRTKGVYREVSLEFLTCFLISVIFTPGCLPPRLATTTYHIDKTLVLVSIFLLHLIDAEDNRQVFIQAPISRAFPPRR